MMIVLANQTHTFLSTGLLGLHRRRRLRYSKMLGKSAVSFQQINKFYAEKVHLRRIEIQKAIDTIAGLVQDILKGVEALEPRFISTFTHSNGRFEGLVIHSTTEYEVVLYLNQMGVFNFVDDGSIPGHAVLKLSDGRKRSMSLWVEFITASGYLSARKIRSRFQALVAQTVEKVPFLENVKILSDSSNVRLLLYKKYTVQITCAFRCNGIWPRSVNQFGSVWPDPETLKNIQLEGFDLLSKEIFSTTSGFFGQQMGTYTKPSMVPSPTGAPMATNVQTSGGAVTNTMEGDAWAISMEAAERILFAHTNRTKAIRIMKTLRDRHLDGPETAITNNLLKTLVLWEFEKHPTDHEWQDFSLGNRIIGILIQLVSCLQCRRCPHYFLPQLDLLREKSPRLLDESARMTWILVRQLLLDAKALESL